jgi:hypothetical protein
MNAKPTALAAVVVVAVGVATGAAIGGKTETRTRTVTVTGVADSAGAVTPPPPPTSASTQLPGQPDQSPSPPQPNPEYKPEVLDDKLVTVDDSTRSSLDTEAGAVTLLNVQYGVLAQLQQGSDSPDSMRFDFASSEYEGAAADYYQFEITVPEGATTFVSEMGFLKGEASGNRVKVAFYKNEYQEGEQFKQNLLDSASETAPVELVVRGMSKIIVRLTCKNQNHYWRTPDDDDPSFGFLDAHFE